MLESIRYWHGRISSKELIKTKKKQEQRSVGTHDVDKYYIYLLAVNLQILDVKMALITDLQKCNLCLEDAFVLVIGL